MNKTIAIATLATALSVEAQTNLYIFLNPNPIPSCALCWMASASPGISNQFNFGARRIHLI